jgi:hypothetical protein
LPVIFEAAQPEEKLRLRRFLLDAFQMDGGKFVELDLLEWKYFAPHPEWSGGRSYVLRGDGAILSHGCASPVCFIAPQGRLTASQIIDWAAAQNAPGAGTFLIRECRSLCDLLLMIGGSGDALRVTPKLNWFRQLAPMLMLARPLHPLRQLVQMRDLGVKTPARFARNLLWSLHPGLPSSLNLVWLPVRRFDMAWNTTGPGIRIDRSAAWLNYLLGCPGVNTFGYVLHKDGSACGCAILACAGPQVRIVDIVTESVTDHTAALAALVRTAAALPGVSEIAAASSLPDQQWALIHCGFRVRKSSPVFVADPSKKLRESDTLEINLSIGDAFYQSDPEHPFLT